MASEVRFTCKPCGRFDDRSRVVASLGGDDASARIAGWRIAGVRDTDGRVEICPECSGQDEEYWDRQTLGIAFAAGIDVGGAGWGRS